MVASCHCGLKPLSSTERLHSMSRLWSTLNEVETIQTAWPVEPLPNIRYGLILEVLHCALMLYCLYCHECSPAFIPILHGLYTFGMMHQCNDTWHNPVSYHMAFKGLRTIVHGWRRARAYWYVKIILVVWHPGSRTYIIEFHSENTLVSQILLYMCEMYQLLCIHVIPYSSITQDVYHYRCVSQILWSWP